VRFVPLIVTETPGQPDVGENPVTVGGVVTMNSVELTPVPFAVVTPIFPVVAPEGTVAVICVLESTE
jgi:hypothetical protein